jgi:two-component system sensor histidine kinase KdpD
MRSRPAPVIVFYLIALLAVAAVTIACSFGLHVFGLASAALLFLLPVLLASALGGFGPGLLAAAAGALAYNFFLLPPRLTLQVHGLDNVVSVAVLFVVAYVTAQLATALKAREADAEQRATASAEAAKLSALLGSSEADAAIDNAVSFIATRYGAVRILARGEIADADGAFSPLDVSAAAWAADNCEMTGHGTGVMPVAGWTFIPLAPPRQSGGDLAAVARPLDGGTRKEAELLQLRALVLLLGQARDRQAFETERRERERLEDRDALRRSVLASLAHDFRTPLTVIAGELASLGEERPEALRALAETRRLDRMMDDLIGAARLEGGALTPRLEAVDLIDVVTDASEGLARSFADLQLAIALPAELPLVTADPVLLRHVLVNLLDNASRHADHAVAVEAKLDGDRVLLSVADDGPGVPAEDRAQVFDRFVRLDVGDRQGGSGLGLAIVRGFADAMGIGVGLEESATGGACFILSLPLREAVAA